MKNKRKINNLSQGLKNYGRSKSTFRKGAVGEWHDYLMKNFKILL